MPGSADISRPQGLWSEKPFAKVFTGPPRYEMQRRSSAGAKDASSTLGKPIYRAQELQTIPITCPFAVWGLDLVGPLKKGSSGFTHLLVAVDKFTKWIEAKPITNLCSEEAVKFFLDIIYRFGVPNCIITDHGTNFTEKKFLDFSDGYSIRID